jgi:hypothetical protein
MNNTRERYYRRLFWVAAAYDIILGIVFLFFTPTVAEQLGFADELPSYGGYIALLAAFVFVIGIAYVYIARGDLQRNRDLIAVGALYKVAYFSVAAYYFAIGDYPHIIFIGFGVADLVFLVLMAECWWYLGRVEDRVRATQPLTG